MKKLHIKGIFVLVSDNTSYAFHKTGVYTTTKSCFPSCNCTDCPGNIVCDDCKGPGWGPMLTEMLWTSIVPEREYLCESCIKKLLGRDLRPGDLRDCPMNVFHPAYINCGVW